MKFNLKAAILAALVLTPAVSFAQEAAPAAADEESNFSWNGALVSDYIFRGLTQTNEDPALQVGVDYAFGDSGFYAGIWGSNVDFSDSAAKEFGTPDVEVDYYVGWSTDLGEKFNLDLSVVAYQYYGAPSDYGSINYNEFIAKFALTDIVVLTAAYTDDYANTGADSTYLNLGNSWEIANEFSLNAGFGRTFDDTNGSYNDWNIGVSKAVGPMVLGLNYYDTTLDDTDTFVFSIKFEG